MWKKLKSSSEKLSKFVLPKKQKENLKKTTVWLEWIAPNVW